MTLFSGYALEFPSSVEPSAIRGNEIFFVGNRRLLALDWATGAMRRIAPLGDLSLFGNGRFACGGVWFPGESFSRFFDAFDEGIEFADEAPGVGAGAFAGNRVVFFDRENKAFVIKELGSRDGLTTLAEPADSLTRFAADEKHIYMHRYGRCVKCFDWEGNEVWTQPTELWHFHRLDRTPVLSDDSVIVSLGVVRSTRADFQVAAFDKLDGHERWRRTLPFSPQNVFHANERIFMALDWQMIVLDAVTGETVIDVPSGLGLSANIEALGVRQGLTGTGLYATDNNLFFVSLHHRVIRVFSSDGNELLQELGMPAPVSPLPLSFWRPLPDRVVASSDRVFVALKLEHGVEALLVLNAAAEGEAGISIAPRPETEIVATNEDGRGCHGFQVTVTETDFDRLTRYGEIVLREVILFHAADATEHDHYDPLFNGHVRLVLQGAKAPPGAVADIEEMKADVMDMCTGLGSYGMNDGRKTPVSFDVALAQ